MGEVTQKSLLEKKIEKSIESGNEINLIKEYLSYVTPKGERTTKNFVNFLNPIFDDYNEYRKKSPDYYAKFLAIYNNLKIENLKPVKIK